MNPRQWADKLHSETIKRHGTQCWPGTRHIAAIIRAAIEDEREACVKVADNIAKGWWELAGVSKVSKGEMLGAQQVAVAIRARGEK